MLPAKSADRDPDRPIVVGFFAPSFDSAAPLMIEPFLRGRDRGALRVVLYSSLPPRDELSRLFDSLADRWQTVGGLDDRAFGHAIRQDGIDILVDTANHIGGHRLPVFAGKHAPIQVSGWCHGLGTGSKAFDYVIGDPILVAQEERRLFVERFLDLPCRTAFQPPAESPPVSPSPSALGQPFSFGHLGRLSKVTEETARLWQRLLARAPDTRLLLKADLEMAAAGTDRVLRLLSSGIDRARIRIVGPKSRFDNMADYSAIDLALDPTPVAGPLTVWESLWMGVPVVTMRGSYGSRPSMSILTAAGIPRFIATDEESYLRVALDLARDPMTLSSLRQELRQRLAASEAGNPERIADAMSRAFRTMWRAYCASA
jgi:predicted O-linked N-acetylglucosamine transferase (SPINDLY family)